MSKDGIDASLGLAFSLELFKRYKKNGVLQAEIPRVSGIRGRCTAFLHLVDGQVVSIYLEDKQKQRFSSSVETLCRLDKEKGPFEWKLVPQPANANRPWPAGPDQSQFPDPLAFALQNASVPRVIAAFPWDRLSSWTIQQRDALYTVLMIIDGERTIENIKATVQLPPELVDELLHILLGLNVIAISAY